MEAILYLEVNLVCIAILFTVYIRDRSQRSKDTCHILFTRVLFSNILFFVADIAWGLLALSNHPHITQNWITNIIYFSVSGASAYFWLDFVEKMINPESHPKKVFAFMKTLPAIILVLLSVTSVKTHWLFYIDSAGRYQRGSLYFLQPLLAYILPVYATFLAVRAVRKCANLEKKRQYRSLALFYLLPAIGGICQVVIAGTPMLNIGIAISGLWVYFTFQDKVIMLDPLTSLNNRRCFDKKLEAHIHGIGASSRARLWLILIDVDYFKKINDGFGHAEGDRALKTIAEVLKEVSGSCNCFAARIGGDEFAVFCESKDEGIAEKLCASIKESLSEKSRRYPFKLYLSMGIAEYENGMTPQKLFEKADERLYAVKKSRDSVVRVS